ncbi:MULTISPECIES: RcnB family protein [unclassified Pseudomonas]|uniref:RcnB family protein n=1 Tax=unclassified Pseudomonas TaxID=196821 RepID=UPI0025D0E794|nr:MULTISPECIES: RcnB family protein [unclassified Pseudomonas]
MNSKSLIAGLAILGCVSLSSFAVHAEDAPAQTIQPSKDNKDELELGSRVPEKYQRKGDVIHNWKAKGLHEPAKESQWVRINDKYVQVQTTNGYITDIVPVNKASEKK